MERIRKVLGPGVVRFDYLAEIRKRFDSLLAETSAGQPLPGRLTKIGAQVHEALDHLDAASRGLVSMPTGTSPLFDPFVVGLLTLNYWHVVAETTAAQADAELAAIVGNLIRHKTRGRPPAISASQAAQIRRLRMDEGLSYGCIAQQLGLSRQRIRTTHKHNYPDDFPEKNSR